MVSVSSPWYSRPGDAVHGYAKVTLVGAAATGSPSDAQLSSGTSSGAVQQKARSHCSVLVTRSRGMADQNAHSHCYGTRILLIRRS